jgi:hypothetical protein
MIAESDVRKRSAVVSRRYGHLRLTRLASRVQHTSMVRRILIFALIILPLPTRACDLCGCFTPQLNAMPKEEMSPTGFYAAVAEQFTHFGTVQFDADEIANPTGQRLDSSITQFDVGYDIN